VIRFSKTSKNVAFSICLGTILLILGSCEFPKPVAPVWDVKINVPLANHLYTVDSLLKKDTSIISVDPANGFITYSFYKVAVSEQIGDKMKMHPDRISQLAIKIGNIPVTLQDYSAAIANPGIPSGIIPPGPLPNVYPGAATFREFEDLTFAEGMMTLRLTNYLPVGVNITNPIVIRDNANNTYGPFRIYALAPGESKSDSVSLAGRRMSNVLQFDTINMTTPGSGLNPVTIPNTIFGASIEFSDAELQSALARFPPTSIFDRDEATFVIDNSPQPNLVSSASFKKGTIYITVTNNLDVSVKVALRLHELYDSRTGLQFNQELTISRQGKADDTLNLADYSVRSSTPTNGILYSASIFQLGSATDSSSYRLVNSNDSVVVQLDTRNTLQDTFVARDIAGILKPIQMSIDTNLSIEIGELPNKFSVDSLRLPDASFTLFLTTPNFPVALGTSYVRLIDSHSGNNVDVAIPQTRLQANQTTQIKLPSDQFVNRLTDLISQIHRFPDMIRLYGNSTVNQEYTSGSLSDTSEVGGAVRLDIPSNIGIKKGTVRDTVKLDFDKKYMDQVQSGEIIFEIENGIPTSIQASILLLDATGIPQRPIPANPITIAAAQVSGDGFVSAPGLTNTAITLSYDELRALVNAQSGVLTIQLDTPPASPSVKFRTSDRVKFRITGTLNYRMDYDRLK